MGSSAMSRSGSHASAIAIITRWAMPPDSSCGNDLSRRSGSGMPTIREQLEGPVVGGGAGHVAVQLEDLADLPVDVADRVQRRGRLLEDHRDPVAPDLPHLLVRQAHEIRSVEHDLAGIDRARRRDEAQDRQAGHALAATGFAHETHDLAAPDREIDPVDGLDHALAGLERGSQAPDLEDRPAIPRPGRSACRRRHDLLDGGLVEGRSEDLDRGRVGHRLSRGSRASRRPSPSRLKAKTVSVRAMPGNRIRCGAVNSLSLVWPIIEPHSAIGG